MLNMNGVRQRGAQRPEDAPASDIMLVSPLRIIYAGPNGNASQRSLGSLVVYVSLDTSFRISIDGGPWDRAEIAVAHPFVPHQIITDDRLIGAVNLEPESIDVARLPDFLSRSGRLECREFLTRARDAFEHLRHAERELHQKTINLDTLFFGQPIERREVDVRVSMTAERIRQRPSVQLDAETCATLTGLSVSRFLHLFKSEVGTTFRRFRAWKRARNMLAHVTATPNLSDFALEAGYPDATHFSHSIRGVYGLSPREIFSLGKRMALHVL